SSVLAAERAEYRSTTTGTVIEVVTASWKVCAVTSTTRPPLPAPSLAPAGGCGWESAERSTAPRRLIPVGGCVIASRGYSVSTPASTRSAPSTWIVAVSASAGGTYRATVM